MTMQLHRGAEGPTWTKWRHRPMRFLILLCLLSVNMFSDVASGLQYATGSKCESVCSNSTAGTLLDDVVCLDKQLDSPPGSLLKDCVTCELNSTAVDPVTNVSDVQWALFNLRYALSNCMFAYPVERVSISSPCQVTCAPLQNAIISNISNSTDITSDLAKLNFCSAGQFDDTTINQCAFCYSFVPEQLFLGNFLQALHIACHSPPISGHAFYPDGPTIFCNATIPGPTTAVVTAPVMTGLTGYRLALAIILPAVAGLALILAACFCCWQYTSHRRRSMADSGRMSQVRDQQSPDSDDYHAPTPGFPSAQQPWSTPPTEMQSISLSPKAFETPNKRGSSLPQGRWPHAGNDSNVTPKFGTVANYAPEPFDPAVNEKTSWQSQDQYIGVATSTNAHATSDSYPSHEQYIPKLS